jgi:hypothetical protein
MPQVTCAVCKKSGPSEKMKYCDKDNLWVHYECAGGGAIADAHCPKCRKELK